MLYGLDISVWQGDIDYTKLKTDFILIKTTEGVGFTDPKFSINQASARNKGLLVGYYHFARPDLKNTAEAEADWFLKAANIKDGEMICLDFEVTYADKVKWCKAWLDRVFSVTKCKPLIYLNQSTVKGNDWSSVISGGYGLWLAEYNYDSEHTSVTTPWDTMAIRQYSNKLVVEGIAGGVDANVFYGDAVAFKAYGFKAPESDDGLQQELIDMRASRDKWKSAFEDLQKEVVIDAQSATKQIESLQKSSAELTAQITVMNGQAELAISEKNATQGKLDALQGVLDATTLEFENTKVIAQKLTEKLAKKSYTKMELIKMFFS